MWKVIDLRTREALGEVDGSSRGEAQKVAESKYGAPTVAVGLVPMEVIRVESKDLVVLDNFEFCPVSGSHRHTPAVPGGLAFGMPIDANVVHRAQVCRRCGLLYAEKQGEFTKSVGVDSESTGEQGVVPAEENAEGREGGVSDADGVQPEDSDQ